MLTFFLYRVFIIIDTACAVVFYVACDGGGKRGRNTLFKTDFLKYFEGNLNTELMGFFVLENNVNLEITFVFF